MFSSILQKQWLWLAIAVGLFGSPIARTQELVVMSSGGFAPAYKLLVPEFETSSGAHVKSVWGPSMGTTSGAIPMRLSRSEPADVVIMARTELDGLARKGLVVEGSQTDLVRSRIGMAVRAGTVVPDISSVAGLRQTLLQANSIAYSDSASGIYIATELYRRLGLEKELAAKSRQIPAEPVGLVVARGEAEIGFQQMSELQPITGITIVGPIPDELQKVTIFAAGVVATSKQQDAARAFIRFLASMAACPEITKSSLEPVACAPTHK
jgi:molybdate transport system substrate-binding protein